MAKKLSFELMVIDEGNAVKAVLKNQKRKLLDYENIDAKPVRVRCPLPDRESFISKNINAVSTGQHVSLEQSVEFYVACREEQVFQQVQIIRRAMKRISREMECVLIAKEELLKHVRKKA